MSQIKMKELKGVEDLLKKLGTENRLKREKDRWRQVVV